MANSTDRPVFLEPAMIVPPRADLAPETRFYQGVPSIAVTPGGHFFSIFYANSNANVEGPGNYAVILKAGVDCIFKETAMVVPPDLSCQRVFDPTIWTDPLGRLWVFWAQSHSTSEYDNFDGRGGVWCAICENPDDDTQTWGTPRRLADGVMLNKPAVFSDGSWVFPFAIWGHAQYVFESTRGLTGNNILITRDNGATFEFHHGPVMPLRNYDEPMCIETPEHGIRILSRTLYGIGESTSMDGGNTWSEPKDSGLGGSCSRFCIRKLRSGRILLVNNRTPQLLPGELRNGMDRWDMCAWLSDDGGVTWYGGMLMDTRFNVAYPDFDEAADGTIYCVYDHSRNRTTRRNGEMILARFTERDVAAGQLVTPGSFLMMLLKGFPVSDERLALRRTAELLTNAMI